MKRLYVAIRYDDGTLHEVGSTVELPDGSPDELAAIDRLIGAGILSPMPVRPPVPMPAPDLQDVDGIQPALREPHPLGDLTNVAPAPPTLPQTAPASMPLSTPAAGAQVTQRSPEPVTEAPETSARVSALTPESEPQPRDAQGNVIPVPDQESPVKRTPRKSSGRKTPAKKATQPKQADPGRGS